MALKLGTLTPTALYLGTTAISAAYLGATQVYSTGGGDAYAIGGASPELVAAFTTQSDGTTAGEYYRKASSETTFSGLFTFSRSGTATYFDSNGTLQTAADGVARTQAYRYNSGWELAGMQMEGAAATQLLHGTDSFATQTETVTAQAYTLQFRGTGSITLSGAHSATLNGTGANDLVSLTFTPSAGTLTLTPSGTVNYPQLETGSIPTSYIPNTAASGTVTRAAETLTIAAANLPFNATGISAQVKGYAQSRVDTGSDFSVQLARWGGTSSTDYVTVRARDGGAKFGTLQGYGESGNTNFNTAGAIIVDYLQSQTPFNAAWRLKDTGSTIEFNAAVNGTVSTQVTPSLSMPNIELLDFYPYREAGGMPSAFVSEIRIWGADIGDSGIAEVTS